MSRVHVPGIEVRVGYSGGAALGGSGARGGVGSGVGGGGGGIKYSP